MARIVVALLKEDQEFQQVQAQDAREVGRGLGLEIDVHFAQGHAVVQIQQLFRYIHAPEGERPLALVVEPAAGDGLERVARNAVKAGIGWILINTTIGYLDGMRREHPGLPIGMVGSDQKEVGRIQGRQVARLAGKRGRVLCVQGPADSSVTHERFAGLKEALAEDYELRALNGDWTEQGAERAVASWLRLKTAEAFRPDVVASQNDSMALGAKRALVKQHPDWGSGAAPRLRRAAAGRAEARRPGPARGDDHHAVEHRSGDPAAAALAAGQEGAAARGADPAAVLPRGGQARSRRGLGPRLTPAPSG